MLKAFIDKLVQDIVGTCEHMGIGLTSVLLHGSLAMGCFYVPTKTDVDLLVVVDASELQSDAFYDLFVCHHDQRHYVGGLEVSDEAVIALPRAFSLPELSCEVTPGRG